MRKIRSSSGFTLTELLIVTGIMSFVAAASLAMMVATMTQGHVMENKIDTVDSVRNSLEKIGREVRMGRSLGDVYGNLITVGTDTVVTGSLSFPSNNDVLYGNGAVASAGVSAQGGNNGGGVPFNGWPVWVDGTQPTTFTCSNTCLIVQTPIFDASGFPIAIPANAGNSTVAFAKQEDNMETHIYRVIADPAIAGEYQMQYAVFPGLNALNTNPPPSNQLGPITICTHIIGPINPATNLPRTFQYLDKTATTTNVAPMNTLAYGTPEDSPTSGGNQTAGQLISNYSGVIVNLELQSTAYSNMQQNVKPFAIRSEVFLRNNAQTTTIGGAT
jgi:prepilin-type N-terminal cleavage/methylation domain-containing protein